MKIIKLTFEDTEGGEYSFYTSVESIIPILDLDYFKLIHMDTKNGNQTILRDSIIRELKLEGTINNS